MIHRFLIALSLLILPAHANTPPPVYTFSAPLTKSGVTIGCRTASGSQSGCVSSSDWTNFNGKQGAISFNSPLVNSSGTISCNVASGSQAGCVSSSDWTTFNGKQSALSFSSPLVNTSGTISCNAASGSQAGCLSSSDWTTFNQKQASGSYITALTSDVSASGPGSVAATVNSVGGSSAANIHSAELAANAATSANTSSTIVARDSNGNAVATNFTSVTNSVVSNGGSTNLSPNSARKQILTGTANETFKLPNATALPALGTEFDFNNNSTGVLTINDNSNTLVTTVPAGGAVQVYATSISSPAGTWDYHYLIPANGSYGTSGLTVTGTAVANNLTLLGIQAPTTGSTFINSVIPGSITGTYNLAIGTNNSGLTSGQYNILIGQGAGSTVATGLENIGIGVNVDIADVTACTAIGYGATCHGGFNVLIGQGSGVGNSSVANAVLGNQAGSTSMTGSSNTLVGYQSGTTLTTGQSNVWLGRGAGDSATNSTSNTFIAGADGFQIGDIYFGNGITDASPSAYTIHGTGGSGSNVAGGNVTISAGISTGSAAGGSFIVKTSPATTSSTSPNTATTQLTIDSTGKAAFAAQVSLNGLQEGITSAKTGAYTLKKTDTVVQGDATSAAFTLTLPTAVGVDGQIYTIKKIKGDTSLNAITIATTSLQTIDGASTTALNTTGETVQVQSDGSNWIIVNRYLPSVWTSWTPTWSSGGTAPAIGNGSIGGMYMRQQGKVYFRISLEAGSTTTFGNNSNGWTFSLPSGMPNINMSNYPSPQTEAQLGFAMATIYNGSSYVAWSGQVRYQSGTTVKIQNNAGQALNDFNSTIPAAWSVSGGNADRLYLDFTAPITGWD